jgi:hypothetical protein
MTAALGLRRKAPNACIHGTSADGGVDRPRLILHRCRLDYQAALEEHLRGGCAARVALVAGSRATSRRNLRRVGLKIIAKLPTREELLAACAHVGINAALFVRTLRRMFDATRVRRIAYRGKFTDERVDPDWRARANAAETYLRLVLSSTLEG